jgi:hypothetical protein
MKKEIIAKLKSIDEVVEECKMVSNGNGSFSSSDFYINDEMVKKFGNGKKYEFVQVKIEGYTHECVEDGFRYHHSWFIMDKPTPEPILFDPDELI